MQGTTYKRCKCPARYNAAGRRLACSKKHGTWSYVVDVPLSDAGRREHGRQQITRGGFASQTTAVAELRQAIQLLEIPGTDDDALSGLEPRLDDHAHAGRGNGKPREERKAENRRKLLEAARKVFAEKGYGEATARDIVRETNLATGTFYNYFKDKQDVFMALLDEMSERGRAIAREQRLDPGRSVEERVFNAFKAYFEWAVSENDTFELFRRNAGVIAFLPDREPFELGISEFFEDLTEWAAAGDIPAVELEMLAVAGVGMGFQVATHLVERDPPDIEGATRFCTRMFMGGLRALNEE